MVKRKIVFRRKKRENRLSMLLVTMVVLMVLAVVSIRRHGAATEAAGISGSN